MSALTPLATLAALPALLAATPPEAAVVVEHLGSLHPVEKVLTLVLAFGPFVVLGVVVALRRRHEDGLDDDPPGGGPRERPERAGQADR